MASVGVVAIGRNEGERLRRCLSSALAQGGRVVYVDSGSTDKSVSLARELGVEVVELDPSIPFSAARARNEGFHRLLDVAPDVEFVQFVDGDCKLASGWIDAAVKAMNEHADAGVVCGRRREEFPEASAYNRLCDIEWDTPVGVAKSCGGDAFIRVAAFRQAGGYNPAVIAAEDDELCVRLRSNHWKVLRIDAEMTVHDAAMVRFGQWWKRAERAGHGFAQGAALHGGPPERHFVKPLRSIWVWGGLLPLGALAAAWPTRGLSLVLLLLAYLLQATRIVMASRRRGLATSHAMLFAANCVLAKFPGLLGALRFQWNRLFRTSSRIIEYK